MVKFCGECGEKILSDVNFCPKCGTNLNTKKVSAQSDVQSPSAKSAKIDLSPQKNKNKLFLKIILVFVVVAISSYIGWKEYQGSVQTKPVVVDEQKAPNETVAPKVVENKATEKNDRVAGELGLEDFILGDVRIGDTEKKIRGSKGMPTSEKHENGRIYYNYPDVGVVFYGGTVREIWTNDKITSTRRNIHSDLSLEEIKKAYGTKYLKSSYENLELYEYTFTHHNGMKYTLRFAINQRQVVDYISVRII